MTKLGRKPVWEEHRPEMVRLYREEGLTRGEIARRFGTSVQTVTRQLLAADVEFEKRVGAAPERTEEERQAINAKISAARTGKGTGARAAREERSCEEPTCDNVFEVKASSKQRFCSRLCRSKALSEAMHQQAIEEYDQHPRVCPCGAKIPFEFRHTRQFCSPEHRSEYSPKRQADPAKQVTFNCGTCGKEVTRWAGYGSSISGMRFCDNACAKKHTSVVKHYVVRDMDMVLDSSWEMLFAGLCGFLKIPIERYKRDRGVEWAPGRWYAPDFLLPTLDIAVEIKGVEDDEDPQRWITFGQHPDTPWLLRLGRADLERMRKADIFTAVLDDIKREQEMRPKA